MHGGSLSSKAYILFDTKFEKVFNMILLNIAIFLFWNN